MAGTKTNISRAVANATAFTCRSCFCSQAGLSSRPSMGGITSRSGSWQRAPTQRPGPALPWGEPIHTRPILAPQGDGEMAAFPPTHTPCPRGHPDRSLSLLGPIPLPKEPPTPPTRTGPQRPPGQTAKLPHPLPLIYPPRPTAAIDGSQSGEGVQRPLPSLGQWEAGARGTRPIRRRRCPLRLPARFPPPLPRVREHRGPPRPAQARGALSPP